MKKNFSEVFLSRKHLIRIMKIYSLLICITISKLFSFNTYSQNISVSLEEVTLQIAINEIEEKSEYRFFYNNNLIDISKKVSLKATNEKLKKVLGKLLIKTNIDFKIYKNQVVLFPKNTKTSEQVLKKLLNSIDEKESKKVSNLKKPKKKKNIAALQNMVSGVVTAQDNVPLPGVNVVIKGTNNGTQTDFDGNYKLEANQGDVLVFSYIGLITKEVIIGTSTTINITLQEDASTLDEVVVVAYGVARKSTYTGSVTQITATEITERPVTNVLTALDGAAAGVRLTPANGQPGSSPTIRVRGIGSVNASSDPLIVVDGVQFTGDFSNLNPNDIASLSILKDAASTSLYGSRAANGVILITTKKGKKGRKDTFTLDVSQGVSTRGIQEYERVSTREYYPLMWEALRNSFSISDNIPLDEANQRASDEIFGNLGINPFNVPNDQIVLTDGSLNPAAELLYTDDLDWQDFLIRTGFRSNLNFSYSGASEKTDYFASIGYLKEDGYLIKTDFERITGRINVNSQLKKWFKTGLNLSVSTTTANNASDGTSTGSVNPFNVSRSIAPIYPVFLHNQTTGAFLLDSQGNRQYDFTSPRAGAGGRNVIQETLLNRDVDEIFSLNSRVYAEFKFLQDFTFTINAALDKRFREGVEFENPIVGDAQGAGRLTKQTSIRSAINYNQLLRYSKDIGKHTLGVLLGHESFEQENNFFEGQRTGVIAEGIDELVNFTTTTDLNSDTGRLTREGYFSNITYDFNDKYYISGSYRRDASSRFLNNRWGDFFSVGGSWRLNQEEFMNSIEWINNLKLRASYGEVGNDRLGSFYISQALFGLNNNNGPEGGILASASGNPDLTWETNIQSDVAIEFGLFNNRVFGTLEYYNRESKDLLFEVPLELENGLDDRPDNIGSLVNSGLELDLNIGIIKTTNFSWDLNINASTLKNEITELPQEEIINGTKKLFVGGDIFSFFLRDWYGVDPADGSALYILDPDKGAVGDSDVRTTADGTIVTTNQNDALFDIVGTATPDLFGSFTNSFKYKNFELGITCTYQLGGETFDSAYRSLLHSGDFGDSFHIDIRDRWQNPGDITDVPRLDVEQLSNFGASSDRWLVKSDFLALRQANLAYNFNRTLTERLGLSSARIYMSGENLFVLNARKGLEPAQRFAGTTSNRFTPARIVTLGFNATF
ncbi:SusC/RagA family TonB-linked outer membrane protein [Aquimarina aggregata]|uniref:SusC/RagA family TonB-linked outer membrane protein n=1 Tax=Aquimarina aggregata TaxID=1642818 RepID=UPI0024933E34|nr:SusC/RagA family TonB-linked outer membrane protein [Aquimarina aggregata]